MIDKGELREGGGGGGRCKQHIEHMLFDLLQLVRGFLYWKDHLKTNQKKHKNGQVLNKPQKRLLLKVSGVTFYQIQTENSVLSQRLSKTKSLQLNTYKACPCLYTIFL